MCVHVHACVRVCVCVKLQAAVYDILPSLEEGARKRCSEKKRECVGVCVRVHVCVHACAHVYL